MTQKPAISVVMPLYNKERDVARAIRSALAQTFIDYELIVVNDGSTDHSVETVATFSDPRIRLVQQANQGVSAARNLGVAEARTDLVAFLDADDEWLPEFLATIWQLKERYPKCGVFATGYQLCFAGHPDRPALLRGVENPFTEGILHDYFTVSLASDPPLWTSAVCIAKEALLAVGGFPVGIIEGEDLLTWARLAANYDIAYSQKPMARYHSPLIANDRPSRSPQKPDLVAEGLEGLLATPQKQRIQGLQQYLGLWHRMRAVTFVKQNQGTDARTEIRLAANRAGMTLRLWVLLLMTYLPGEYPAIVQTKLKTALHDFRSRRQDT